MSLQTTVRYDYGFGVPGDIRLDGPRRAITGLLVSGSAANNIIGSACTQASSGGAWTAGGTGATIGILANSKVYAGFGTAGNPLAPSIVLPNNTEAEFLIMGFVVVNFTNANVAIGDVAIYANATGLLTSQAASASVPSGSTLIPSAVVHMLPQPTAGGLALLRLTQ